MVTVRDKWRMITNSPGATRMTGDRGYLSEWDAALYEAGRTRARWLARSVETGGKEWTGELREVR